MHDVKPLLNRFGLVVVFNLYFFSSMPFLNTYITGIDYRARAGMILKYTYLDCLAQLGVGGAHPGGLQLTKEVLTKERLGEATTVLDVGCGTGQTSAYLADKYQCKVTALDNNPTMLDKARQRFKSLNLPITVEQGSAEALPFAGGSYDVILSESVLAFTDAPISISEFKRVLAPNGVLLATEMVLEKPVSKQELAPILDFYGISKLRLENEWKELFLKQGFKQISVEQYQLELNDQDLQNAVEFVLSEDINSKFFDILDRHEQYANVYKDLLGYRVFRCK